MKIWVTVTRHILLGILTWIQKTGPSNVLEGQQVINAAQGRLTGYRIQHKRQDKLKQT